MRKDLFAFYKFYDEQGNVRITDEGVADISALADIVIAKHFYLNSSVDKEDLKSIGILKCISLLKDGSFDSSKSSLKNYCYTGMRNEMSNYIYKVDKITPVEDEILVNNVDAVCSGQISDGSDAVITIFPEEILFLKEYERQQVINRLLEIGFFVKGESFNEVKDMDVDRREMLTCLIIWRHLERYRS